MKLRSPNLLFLILPVTFLACTNPKRAARTYTETNAEINLVHNLLIFPTCSNIQAIEKGDKLVGSDRFSREAESEINNRLIEYIPSAIPKQFMENDSLLKESVASSGVKLIKSLKKTSNLKKVEVPDYLLHILDAQNQDYGLLILQVGFTRTPENLKKEYIRRKELGLAALGIYTTEPNSSYSTMFGVLIDKKRKRVVRYKELRWRNKDPNDKHVIRSQIRDLILNSFQMAN